MKIKFSDVNTKSNYISLSRLLLAIPIMISLDYITLGYEYRILAFGLMMLAYITDILDGYFARKFNEITEAGKIIDPLADKIAIALIVIKLYLIGAIPGYFFWIIILRDVIIFTGGIIVSNIVGKVLPSNLLGKLTVLFIGIFMLGIVLGIEQIKWLYNLFLYGSIIFSFASVAGYAVRAIEYIRWKKNETL